MFKKLKDKIAEEVKSSPSRIQQLAQVAQVNATNPQEQDGLGRGSNADKTTVQQKCQPRNISY